MAGTKVFEFMEFLDKTNIQGSYLRYNKREKSHVIYLSHTKSTNKDKRKFIGTQIKIYSSGTLEIKTRTLAERYLPSVSNMSHKWRKVSFINLVGQLNILDKVKLGILIYMLTGTIVDNKEK